MVENLGIRFDEIPEFEGVETGEFGGEKISIDSILNTPIAILKFRTSPSSFYENANYMLVQIMTYDSIVKWFATSSRVLEKQLKEQEAKLPVKCKIVKVKICG